MAGAVTVAPGLLVLAYGRDFVEVARLVRWLGFGLLLTPLAQLCSTFWTGTGRLRPVLIAGGSAAVIDIALAWTLDPEPRHDGRRDRHHLRAARQRRCPRRLLAAQRRRRRPAAVAPRPRGRSWPLAAGGAARPPAGPGRRSRRSGPLDRRLHGRPGRWAPGWSGCSTTATWSGWRAPSPDPRHASCWRSRAEADAAAPAGAAERPAAASGAVDREQPVDVRGDGEPLLLETTQRRAVRVPASLRRCRARRAARRPGAASPGGKSAAPASEPMVSRCPPAPAATAGVALAMASSSVSPHGSVGAGASRIPQVLRRTSTSSPTPSGRRCRRSRAPSTSCASASSSSPEPATTRRQPWSRRLLAAQARSPVDVSFSGASRCAIRTTRSRGSAPAAAGGTPLIRTASAGRSSWAEVQALTAISRWSSLPDSSAQQAHRAPGSHAVP